MTILNTIKNVNNIENDDINFDSEILSIINDTFTDLRMIGVSIKHIEAATDSEWESMFNDNEKPEIINMSKKYTKLKTILFFDNNHTTLYMQNIKSEMNKIEWLIYTMLGREE